MTSREEVPRRIKALVQLFRQTMPKVASTPFIRQDVKARAPKGMEKTKESTFTGSLIQTTTEKAVSPGYQRNIAALLRRRSRPLTSVVLTTLRLDHRFKACMDYEVEPGQLMERASTGAQCVLKPKTPSSIPRGHGEGWNCLT